ncbi:MAG: ACP phosphodiesterase [Pseudomonadota bacterium]
MGPSMNYLAHLHLSQPTPLAWLGSLLADFERSPDHSRYPPELLAAVQEHRRIDAFTDNHPAVRTCRRRLAPDFHLLRGVVVDIFFDHMLALNWSQFSSSTLDTFCQSAYAGLAGLDLPLPPRLAWGLPRMASQDWLRSYLEIDNVGLALGGVARRLRRPVDLAQGVVVLRQAHAAIEQDFLTFYPELIDFVRRERQNGEAG